MFAYEYPRPAYTVDALIFSADDKVLLIQRKNPPFKGLWALPGGFVDMDETIEKAASRELEEETGLTGINLEQMRTFSAIDRDPRGRTISTVFIGFAGDSINYKVKGKDDAIDALWFPLSELPLLAFDHKDVINYGIEIYNNRKPKL